MPLKNSARRPLIVLKFGSSILRDERDLDRVVEEIRRWVDRGHRVIAVVSAFKGRTDALLQSTERYRAADGSTHAPAVANLAATGETESAALLTLALHRARIAATLLDAAAIGLLTAGPTLTARPRALDEERLEQVLNEHDAVVVPGFAGRSRDGSVTLLGRGGSDLTALFLAWRLGGQCRLVKDTGGVLESDPAERQHGGDRPPRRYRSIHWSDSRAMRGRVVQARAAELALTRRIAFEIGGLGNDTVTKVGDVASEFEQHAEHASTTGERSEFAQARNTYSRRRRQVSPVLTAS